MSTAVESSHHIFGTTYTVNNMSQSLYNPYEAYSSKHAHYMPEQQSHQPHLYRQQQQHRLPPVTTILPVTGPGPVSSSCDPVYRGHSETYYSDYPTPSPVGQTPPQLPITYSEARSYHGRQLDGRLSPAYSTAASEKSTAESTYEPRSRQTSNGNQAHVESSWPPFHQQPSRLRQESSSHFTMVRKASTLDNNHSSNNSPSSEGSQTPSSSQQGGSPRQESRPMSISNLISTDNTRNKRNPVTLPPPPSGKKTDYRIFVRQQPFAARSCGFGERDRRVIDPPPIVQLTIHNDTLSREEHSRLLRHQFSVIHCSIWDETGVKDMSSMPEDFRQQRRLMGTLVASPFVGLDENGEEGCFFCFPDLSCRTPGTFRLKFALVVLDPARMMAGDRSSIVATVMSEPFHVYNAKDFPGMKASTPLTKRLKRQGCLISIKKGNEKGGNGSGSKGDREEESGEEDEEDADGEESGRGGGKKGRKRQKRVSCEITNEIKRLDTID
ncbi:velvet factor domain-containing protein [Neurospora intermedia]|uniref:Velvet factor domain-containing protein n=1 Tax=Neurospora intermedia TaxID=5142 RepID=A0ABR3DJW7_NEUIN